VKYENSLRWTSCSYSVLDEQHYLDANWVCILWGVVAERYMYTFNRDKFNVRLSKKKNCLLWGTSLKLLQGRGRKHSLLIKGSLSEKLSGMSASLKLLIQGRGRQHNLGFCYLGFCFGFCYILGELETEIFFSLCLAWLISPSLASGGVLLPVTTMSILYYPCSLFCLIHMPQNI
jgi:hypothetical protein